MAAMLLVTVIAPCALAAEAEDTMPQAIEATDEAAGDTAAAAEDEATAAEPDEPAPAPAQSEKIYNSRNLILGGASIGLMLVAFIILRVKSKIA